MQLTLKKQQQKREPKWRWLATLFTPPPGSALKFVLHEVLVALGYFPFEQIYVWTQNPIE